MARIRKATLKEIAGEMRREYPTDGSVSFGHKILEEDLWGEVNGVYRPLAKINLPVLYGGIDLNHDDIVITQIATAFNKSFYGGWSPGCSSGELGLPCECEYWNSQPGRKIFSERDNYDPEVVLRDHVKKFLELYGEMKRAPGEFEGSNFIRESMREIKLE